MQSRHYRRRRKSTNRSSVSIVPILKIAIGTLVIGAVFFGTAKWFLQTFSGSTIQKASAMLAVEGSGLTNVSINKTEWKRANSGLKLFAGDRIATTGTSTAQITFFDSTTVRLNSNSELEIIESNTGDSQSEFSLFLHEGDAYIQTPEIVSLSGSIARLIGTDVYTASLPSGTEALVTKRSFAVFDGEGIGASIQTTKNKKPVIVGEGQILELELFNGNEEDLYKYRKPLNPQLAASEFVQQSKSKVAVVEPKPDTTPIEVSEILTVANPTQNQKVDTSTITVSGTVGSDVSSVRINGYKNEIKDNDNRYSVELSLPDEDEVAITVEALNEEGTVLEETRRTILRNREPPAAPTFISPAGNGQTYQTNQRRLEIVGEAPKGAIGIVVNDYRLQFFKPGDTRWKYLASTDLSNYQEGENTFTAYAINKAGIDSEKVTLTIILGTDSVGIVPSEDEEEKEEEEEEEEEANQDTQTSTEVSFNDLPQNEPLNPGTLQISGPSTELTFTTNEEETLIEGIAPRGTQSVWVNDYRLKLYKPENRVWNYIASLDLKTMKRGRNVYVITARNDQNEIIDSAQYVLTFEPN